MSIHVVKVPDIGEGIAEVELVLWHVQEGDAIRADQALADLMTDKATVEVPSPVAGRVLALGGAPGDKLAVGSELIRLEVEATDASYSGNAAASRAAPKTPSATAAENIDDEPHASEATVAAATPTSIGKPLASPSVRRHARELAIDLARVPGTGPDGRIVHDDVVRYATGSAENSSSTERYAKRSGLHPVPVIGLRRQIALRMRDALRIPHFTYVEEVDVTELEVLRARLNDGRDRQRGHLTVLPLLMRAIVLAVRDFPQMNARFDDDKGIVTRYAGVHIGVATQTESGLMVPVVRHAEARDPWSSAAEVARLAEAARTGRATRDELSGSTITITSLGPLGGIVTTPVINPPEVAIVGVNRIVERPVIRAGAIVPRAMMNLSSSFDHRVVDGQQAAQFVQALRRTLECPALLFVD
ncbi:MAG: 2-oxo acid dehydrogenase subunit E2 [Burkholderiales bacterium]|nr:2-oxo acid dehydrogenase subunit E2 [Burkholderiales bacterium]